jgi:predicted nucleic acid-binding Zn ribbon protein
MTQLRTPSYEFVCPERGEQFEVDGEMRGALLASGCPVCGASVSRADFVSLSSE